MRTVLIKATTGGESNSSQARLSHSPACLAGDHFAAIEKAKNAQFGRAVCAALIQLAAAFWRHYVGGEPPFVRGK